MWKFVILLAAFGLAGLPIQAKDKVEVTAFSTILTEIAEQVGGDRANVTGLVKPGVDPHEYEPKPADLKRVSQSDLVLLSAKHLEGYVGKLKESTGTRARVVAVGDGFASLKIKDEHDPSRTIEDPHWWHSIACVEKAVGIVRDELAKVSPEDKTSFTKNAETYLSKLGTLRSWVKSKVAELPKDKRKLVTSHDAFQYFAKENGFTVYAIEGVSSSDQPSSKKVADLIALIKEQRVKAIFPESLENPKVLKEITRETGAVLGGELFADGLGEGQASTFDGMYRQNVSRIVNALK